MNSINPANPISSINTKYFLLTIDVEDWFQVENFRRWNPHSIWESRELRVEKNVHRLLDLFDSIEFKSQNSELNLSSLKSSVQRSELNRDKPSQPNQLYQPGNLSEAANKQKPLSISKPKATFFILGWIAEKLPGLVREILVRGHEVASHGYNHEMPNLLTLSELKDDLIKSKILLEDIIGTAVTGYRAPSFAIDDNILKIIGECGYHYDSSYNSFSLHGRYGAISLTGYGKKEIAHKINEKFYELPVSNLQLRGIILPLGGGGYFRLIPEMLFKYGVKSILNKENTYLLFLHPWELDPEQPKVKDAYASYKFRHYVNLKNTRDKLINLIDAFSYCRFITCSQYLSIQNAS